MGYKYAVRSADFRESKAAAAVDIIFKINIILSDFQSRSKFSIRMRENAGCTTFPAFWF